MKWRPALAVQLVLGPALWLLWFAASYGALSLACALAPPPAAQGAFTWINAALLALTAASAAAFARAAWTFARAAPAAASGQRFLPSTAAILYAVAAASTVAVGVPLMLLPPCV